MKSKLVLLITAAVGSMALVASAQQPSYVITSGRPGGQEPAASPPVVVGSAFAQALPTPAPKGAYGGAGAFRGKGLNDTFGGDLTVYGVGRPQVWTLSGEEAGLSHQAEQLAQQLAGAKSDSDREKIKSQLAETLEKQFDQRQKRHEDEIKELEAQVKKLKDLVEKRQENRREIISSRLNQIVKESQGLGW